MCLRSHEHTRLLEPCSGLSNTYLQAFLPNLCLNVIFSLGEMIGQKSGENKVSFKATLNSGLVYDYFPKLGNICLMIKVFILLLFFNPAVLGTTGSFPTMCTSSKF